MPATLVSPGDEVYAGHPCARMGSQSLLQPVEQVRSGSQPTSGRKRKKRRKAAEGCRQRSWVTQARTMSKAGQQKEAHTGRRDPGERLAGAAGSTA